MIACAWLLAPQNALVQATTGTTACQSKPFTVNGTNLGKYKDDTVFEIRGGGTFSGVHVADPSALEINPPKTK